MNQDQYQKRHLVQWILLVLSSAQRDGPTELIMAPATEQGTALRQKVRGTWHDWAPSPGLEWPLVMSELSGLAGVRDEPYRKQGIIYVAYSGVRVRWDLRIPSEGSECVLRNLGNEFV